MKIVRYINGVRIEENKMPKLNIINSGVIQLYTNVQLRLQANNKNDVKDANK